MDDLAEILARLRGAWMAGGLAQKHCPPDWAVLAGEGPSAELALAALAGQALQTSFRPLPGTPLATRDDLPVLAFPSPPSESRPRLRRLLTAQRGLLRPLLILLETRGFAMHPADWLPAKREHGLPALYAPWCAWVNEGETASAKPPKPSPKPTAPDPALPAELAGMVSIETLGLLRRHKRMTIPKLKTGPQMARRRELFAQVTLAALAAALKVPENDLVAVAPAGVDAGIGEFSAMVATTGTQAQQHTLFAAILADKECPLAAARLLSPSMKRADLAALLPALLEREDSPGFELTIDLAGEVAGTASFAALARAPGFAALRALAAPDDNKPATGKLAYGLAALGLLADQAAAQAIIALYLAAGLSPADPKLDMLYLNTALTQEASA